jgi:CheY-like chemotaxis protein
VWNQIRLRSRLVKSYGKIPAILGNKSALGQVFLNLLLNAAQSIPEGDANHNAVQITTSIVPGEKGAELVVEISDSGKGISPEDMSHLFEPFFTTKPFGEGTGLGLSISHQTVREHGGRITVDSSSGKGTTFRVFLPVGADVLPPPIVIGPLKTSALPRGRVLVIDDEPLIGRVIQNVLNREHEVVVVERAGDALARLQDGERFDAILCDLVMPDVSGPEFYAAVAERWPDLVERLVFMSGGAFTSATRAFMAHLSPCVLRKPFQIDHLKDVVRERMQQNTSPPGPPVTDR